MSKENRTLKRRLSPSVRRYLVAKRETIVNELALLDARREACGRELADIDAFLAEDDSITIPGMPVLDPEGQRRRPPIALVRRKAERQVTRA